MPAGAMTNSQSKKSRDIEAVSTASTDLRAMPRDAGGFVYAIMFFQGVGQLFPWNAFITAASYFGQRFCTTPFAGDFENYLSITFTASQTIGLVVTILYGASMSYHSKIVVPLVLYAVLFGFTTTLVLIPGISGNLLFWLTLLCCVGCGTTGAFLNAGFFSLSSVFPPSYTGAMMSGQGLAGFTVGLTGLITQAAGPAPEGFCLPPSEDSAAPAACVEYKTNWSAFSYFLISTLVLVACIGLFYVMMKLPFTIYNLRGQEHLTDRTNSRTQPDVTMHEPLISGEEDRADTESERLSGSSSSTRASTAALPEDGSVTDSFGLSNIIKRNSGGDKGYDMLSNSDNVGFDDNKVRPFTASRMDDNDSACTDNSKANTSVGAILSVYKVIRSPALTVFGIFAVTLAIFPSLVVFLRSSSHCAQGTGRFHNDLFVPMFFLMFNLCDFCGRLLAGWRVFLNKDNVHIAGLARFVFFPLFLLCNLGPNTKLPVVFESDFFPFFFMVLFGVSNGYVCSCCMMIGPTMVDVADAPMAGNIMIFCLTAGLMAGSMLSFPLTLISQGTL